MNDFFLSLLLLGAASSGGVSPFWATANRYDIVPQGYGATFMLQTGMQSDTTKAFQWGWGVSAGVSTDTYRPVCVIPDEAYGTVRWKFLSLDLGLKRRQQDFLAPGNDLGTLSTTGGNMIWSGNAATMPGYTFNVGKVTIPGTQGYLSLFGRFGDYCATDRRYVQWSHIHNTAFGMQVGLSPDKRWLLTAALDHYAMWGGTSPEYGKLDMSIKSYCRMLVGASGNYSEGDAINVIGNQLGHMILRLDYKADKWSLAFQHDHPYEDKSGMLFRNFPDGVNTLAFRLEDRKFWITDVVYEFQYTLWQGGTCERRPATQEEIDRGDVRLLREPDGTYSYIVGGEDNYFNNIEYRSGWTHGARIIGNPFFLPLGTLDGSFNPDSEKFREAVAQGAGKSLVAIENNRVMVHHLGISGTLFRMIPYKLMLTHSLNYGIYHSELYTGFDMWRKDWSEQWRQKPKVQFSGAFQCEVPLFRNKFFIVPAICWDRGQVLGNRVGATLGLRYNFFGFRQGS